MDEELKSLFERRESARMYYESLGRQNCYGLPPEKQIELDIAYERARREWMQAEQNYHAAIAVAALENVETVYH